MPLYDYRCSGCGTEFELLERMNAIASKRCRVCGGQAERIISSSSLQFKGSGFHCTDYGRYGRKNNHSI